MLVELSRTELKWATVEVEWATAEVELCFNYNWTGLTYPELELDYAEVEWPTRKWNLDYAEVEWPTRKWNHGLYGSGMTYPEMELDNTEVEWPTRKWNDLPWREMTYPEVVDPKVGDLILDPVEGRVVAGAVLLLHEVGQVRHPWQLVWNHRR